MSLARPLVCLVTDRRRLALRDARPGDPATRVVDLVRAAARAGVDLVQVRERDLSARALFDLVVDCVEAARGTAARVVVNDRIDVALAAGAAGGELRGESIEASRIRTIVPPGFLIGRSVHGAAEAVAAAGRLDFLIFGTVFSTPSKPVGSPVVGLFELALAVRMAAVPVLAIGGVTDDTLPAIAGTGAAGFAATGWFIDAWRPEAPASRLADRIAAARRLFDTPHSIP